MTVSEFTQSEMPPELATWLRKAHGDSFGSEVFFGSGRKALVVSDAEGAPVMFVRLSEELPALRVDIQFDPDKVTPLRTAKALKALDEFVFRELPAGVTEIVFDSTAEPLIACMVRIGFAPKPDVPATFSKKLEGR